MTEVARVQVLLQRCEAERFERFCRLQGHKMPTLIAHLIRKHLDRGEFEARPVASRRRACG